MKRLLLILCLVSVTGCAGVGFGLNQPPLTPVVVKVKKEYPTVNLPRKLRQENWLGSKNEGSCVHASLVMALRWQNRPKTADWWKAHNGNGEYDTDLATRLNRAGIKYAYTSKKNDVKFLEWACNTRRGACVTVLGGRHMIFLVHLDKKWAGLIDNNEINRIRWVPRATFLAEWENSTSWAIAPIYSPTPPRVQK